MAALIALILLGTAVAVLVMEVQSQERTRKWWNERLEDVRIDRESGL